MSDAVQIAIITSIATAVPILFGMWLAHRSQVGKIDSQAVKIDKVVTEFNGMKDALVHGASREGLAQGKIEGHADGVKDQKIAQMEKAEIVTTFPAPTTKSKQVKLEVAIEQLTDAAQETVEAAEKTVEHADKIKP